MGFISCSLNEVCFTDVNKTVKLLLGKKRENIQIFLSFFNILGVFLGFFSF